MFRILGLKICICLGQVRKRKKLFQSLTRQKADLVEAYKFTHFEEGIIDAESVYSF